VNTCLNRPEIGSVHPVRRTNVASGVDCMMNLGLSGEKGKTMLSVREITKR
jgi:hypothetical protein